MIKSTRRVLLTGAAAALAAPAIARADTWPTRPIRSIVALPPAAGTHPTRPLPIPSLSLAHPQAPPGTGARPSPGPSTRGHPLTRQFELIAGLTMIDAPYKGAAAVYPDLMNGTVAVMLDNPSGSAGLVRENRLTGFAVTRPSTAVPDVPTFDSLGVKNFEDVFWYGVVAPAGLPPEIADRIQ